jgi:hypothetical protein
MTDFGRLRSRRWDELPEASGDPHGKRTLFSDPPQRPATPLVALSIRCSSCGDESLVSVREAVRLALPSLHLPLIRRHHESWMLCPACDERTWVRLRVRV